MPEAATPQTADKDQAPASPRAPVERHYGAFRLPGNIDGDSAKATFDKAVLTVTLPKMAESKTRRKKIEISKG